MFIQAAFLTSAKNKSSFIACCLGIGFVYDKLCHLKARGLSFFFHQV